MVIVYAPSKAHVVLPAIADRLPAEKVARFTGISYDDPMPRADIFLENLMNNIDARETLVRRWCAEMLLERDGPGDRDKARGMLEEAIESYREIGMPKHVEMAEALLEKL